MVVGVSIWTGLGIAILGESDINLVLTHQEIVRFDIMVNEVTRVDLLNMGNLTR